METNLSRMMEARINPQLEDVELNDDGTEQTEEQFQEMIEKVRARARALARREASLRAPPRQDAHAFHVIGGGYSRAVAYAFDLAREPPA